MFTSRWLPFGARTVLAVGLGTGRVNCDRCGGPFEEHVVKMGDASSWSAREYNYQAQG